MKEDIFTLFLLIVALTFHGTGAKCLQNDAFCRQCDTICRARGREGRNCCFGTQGGYRLAHHNPQAPNYDIYDTCRRGTCDLTGLYRSIQGIQGYTCQHCLRYYFILCFHDELQWRISIWVSWSAWKQLLWWLWWWRLVRRAGIREALKKFVNFGIHPKRKLTLLKYFFVIQWLRAVHILCVQQRMSSIVLCVSLFSNRACPKIVYKRLNVIFSH